MRVVSAIAPAPAILAVMLLAGCGMIPRMERSVPEVPFVPPSGGLMVTADSGGSLTVLDNASRSRLYSVVVPGSPRDLVAMRDGNDVLVSVRRTAGASDAVLRYNIRTKEETGRIPLELSDSVGRIALSPDAKRAAVISERAGEVLVLDLEKKSIEKRLALGGETLRDIAWLADGTLALAAGNALLRVQADGSSPSSFALAGPALAVAAAPTGDKVAVAISDPGQVAIVTGATARAIVLPEARGPSAVAFSPNGGHVFVADGGRPNVTNGYTIYRVDPTISDPPARYTVGLHPRALIVDGAGVAWVANAAGGTVTVINPDGSFAFELPVGSAPTAIVTVSIPAAPPPSPRPPRPRRR